MQPDVGKIYEGKVTGITKFGAFIELSGGKTGMVHISEVASSYVKEISDHLTLQKAEKGSRCAFSRAAGLLGRNEDILWFTDGNGNREFLHPLAIEGFCIEGLLDYQFQQTSEDAFEMLAETSGAASRDEISREMLEQMSGILKEKKLSYVQFYVRFVDEITPDPQTGKKRLIVNSFEEERPAV